MSLTRFRLKEASIWLVGLGLLAGAVVLSYRMGTAEFVDEFAALSLRNKALVGGGVVLGIVLIGEIWTRSTVDFSAVIALAAGTFWVVEEMQEGETQRAQSGREKYYSGVGDSVRRGLTHAGGDRSKSIAWTSASRRPRFIRRSIGRCRRCFSVRRTWGNRPRSGSSSANGTSMSR